MDGVLFGTELELGSQPKHTLSELLPIADYIEQVIRQGTGVGDVKNETAQSAFLKNAARLYNDMSHLEYSTPECKSLFDLVGFEGAIDHIIRDVCRTDGFSGRVFIKNNIDYCGNCFGYHENYHFLGGFSIEDAGEWLVPHLVSRQVITGAGAVLKGPPWFAIS